MPNVTDIPDFLFKLALLGFAIVVVYAFFQRRYAFVVHVDARGTRMTRGKVTGRFRDAILAAFQQAGISRGWVAGYRRGKLTALHFSGNVPSEVRQQLRNQWLYSQ